MLSDPIPCSYSSLYSHAVAKALTIRLLFSDTVKIAQKKFMVGKFNSGREWIIDGLVQDGCVLKTFVTYVPTSPLTAMTEQKVCGHIACSKKPNEFKFLPKELEDKMII